LVGATGRLGRWTRFFASVADPQGRSIIVHAWREATVSRDRFLIRQRATVQPLEPGDDFYLLLMSPQRPALAHRRDDHLTKSTGRTLARPGYWSNRASSIRPGKVPVRLVQTESHLIGISGDVADAILLQAQIAPGGPGQRNPGQP